MSDRREKLEALAEKARQLPKVPGVYLMKDAAGVVLYVGKARVLPNRVSTYFQPATDLGPKKQRMIGLIDDFDVIECEGEWEALLTENRLIKDLHPKFNERLTDDKTFPYLVITTRDDFPGVFITREPSHERFRGGKVFGPFTSVYALRESMKLLQKVFRFRTCELSIREDDDKRRFFRPCLLYPIKQCTGPCAAKISKEAYRADIQRFIRFLESKRSVMLRELRTEMEQAAERRDYETAAALRDQIGAIEKLDERGKLSSGWQPETESFYIDPAKGLASLQRTLGMDTEIRCVEGIDIAHLHGQQTVGSKVCFVDGKPLKNEYRKYKITTASNDDFMSIREVVSRAYRDAGDANQLYPDVVLIDGGPGQLSAAMEAFAQFDLKPPMVISLAKKEELIYQQGRDEPIRLGRDNPGLKLCQSIRDEAHRFAQAYHHLLRKKNVLEQ
ncbi:MAG: excinuclease ABC subunit UvrC [Phycisphaera sp.]|nr:excinuclease ABC subunit UvrC [Phycisphaera sp.]